MRFLNPWNLLWLLPISGLIVVMYILKLRRKDVVVSSTFLWRQVIRDVQANAPFQKLRKNLLLLLQLLIAACIIFALARPFLRVSGIGGRAIILVIDASASMQATDVKPSRLEVAKRKAHELLRDRKPGDRVMILAAAARPKPLTGFTEEAIELHRAIDTLQASDTPTAMRDTLNLAADLVAARNRGESGRIELLSDGGFLGQGGPQGPGTTLTNLNLGKTHVAFHPIGTGNNNVGITAIDYRRNLGEEKTSQLLVVTHNFSDKPQTFNQEIYADDNLLDAHEVTLPPQGEATEPFDIPEPEQPVQIRVKLDANDHLAADNTGAIVLAPRKTIRALLVGRANLFLENALKVDPGVELSRTEQFTEAKDFDVVVFYEQAPAQLPPGNYLFLHCTSDQAPVKAEGKMENVAPADWDKEHPALRYVDLSAERFGNVLKATPAPWGREIAVGDSGSLIVAGEREGRRSLFVAFALSDSIFPLRVAFPIFIANSVRWLGTGDSATEFGQTRTGTPVALPVPSNAGTVKVTRPDGSQREAVTGEKGGAVFDEVDKVGIYRADGKGFAYTFAANLADAAESDITPRRNLTITDNPTPTQGRRVVDTRELLPWLIGLALLILGVEWWVFHRRVYVS